MSYNRAYTAGEKVKVDAGVFVASPTLGPCTVPCVVLMDTPAATDQVYISRESNHDTLYVFKDRISP